MADFGTVWRQITWRTWVDPAYKERLLAEPDAVLAEEGFQLPKGMRFNIVENTSTELNLVLCPSPEEISQIAPADNTTIAQYQAECV